MTFPSANGTRAFDLASAWSSIRWSAADLKGQCVTMAGIASTTGATSTAILEFATFIAGKKAELTTLAAVPGLADYAQQQINDPTFNIVTAYETMITAVDACTAWIVANFPKDAQGFLQRSTFNPDNSGRQVDQNFSASVLGEFVTTVNAVAATID